jgi:hypothetical protein
MLEEVCGIQAPARLLADFVLPACADTEAFAATVHMPAAALSLLLQAKSGATNPRMVQPSGVLLLPMLLLLLPLLARFNRA